MCIPTFKQEILSVRAATKQGVHVNFKPNGANLITNDGTEFEIDQKDELYFINKIVNDQGSIRTLQEWHNVLGHCNIDDILKLSNVVDGMKITNKVDFSCDVCLQGKFARYFNRTPDARAENVLGLVHCDIAGPIDPISRDGAKYAINFVDDKSGFIHVYCIKNKSDAPMALKKFFADSAPYGRVKCIRTDNALEFKSEVFESILREKCVRHEFSAPHSPHQNGTAERSWRSLFEMTRCLLIEAKLPKTFLDVWIKDCRLYAQSLFQ